jgi:hypothetical protein
MPHGIIIFSLCLLLLMIICSFGIPKISGRKNSDTAISTRDVVQMSTDQINDKLNSLPPKKNRNAKMEAMCYSMPPPQTVIDYICPACHEKTLYYKSVYDISLEDLNSCRQIVMTIKKSEGYSVTLDELSFCSHCSPNAIENKLKLIVTSDDGSKHITSPVSLHDLTILKSFIDGNLTYNSSDGNATSLKAQIPRLQQLLGDKIDNTLLNKLKD